MSQGQDWNDPSAPQAYQQPSFGQQQGYGQQPYAQQPYAQQQPYQAYPQAPLVPATAYGAPGLAAAQVPAGMYYDQASGLTLPQGTQLASVGRRIGSYFLAIPLLIVTLGIGYLIWGAITWAKGQTPTQSLLGMQTWRPQTGTVPTWGEQFLREISRIVYVIPFIGWIVAIISFVIFVTNNQRRALHDSMGGAVVLYDPNRVLQQQAGYQPPQQPAAW